MMRSKFPLTMAAILMLGSGAVPADAADGVSERFTRVARSTDWQLVESIAVQFPTYHPQGMVKIGERIYFSTVEILEATQRYPELRDGLDRSAGKGVGHLFEMDLKGTLLREVKLGEGDVYHPGGIDFDGTHIWVPVAEYRPNSHSIVYRVDPKTMQATKVLTFADHVGGIVHDTVGHTLHGVSWGSRRFYRWTLDRSLNVTNATTKPEALRKMNPAFYIDYQDCHYVGDRRMLCSGLNNYRMRPDGPPFPLGGLELVDLKTDRPLHQIPVALWTDTGIVMTQNPFWVETSGSGLRLYFMPEDDKSRVFVYDAKVN
jgi:Family of unknown function (DUF6454)